jgi:hypothetical protein
MIGLALALTVLAIASATSPLSPASWTSQTSWASLAPPVVRVLGASVTPGEVTYGAGVAVTGHLTDGGQGVGAAPLALQADSYPFRGFATVARLTTGTDGSFSFVGVRPNRDSRLRVVLEGSPATRSPVLAVIVDPSAASKARNLGPGRTRLSLRVRHTRAVGSASVRAWWFVAARGTRVFRLAAVTATSELSPGVTYATVTVDPPSKRFVYRVCLNPTWEYAMGAPATHRPCPQHDFAVRHSVG